jgi:hypothetical protein
MKLAASLIALLLSASAALANPVTRDTLILGKETYTACTIARINPVLATIKHATGIARVPITSLPADLQSALGYDPAAAAAYLKEAAAKAKAAAAQKEKADRAAAIDKKAQRLEISPYYLTDDGILCTAAIYERGADTPRWHEEIHLRVIDPDAFLTTKHYTIWGLYDGHYRSGGQNINQWIEKNLAKRELK